MPPLFTEFVHNLGQGCPEGADAAWDRLRLLLHHELRRRGLWRLPPSYLGLSGWRRWDEGASPDDALEELAADCYGFIFVDRLRGLQNQLRLKPDIEGLVLLNVRHFLLERQKEHDPLGFHIFEMAQAAVRDAVAQGDLHVVAGDSRIGNDTLLGFDPGAQPPPSPPDLAPIVTRWNDELLPDLVTALGRRQHAVLAQLRGCLGELSNRSVEAFRFQDLVEPLKSDVRARWVQLWPEARPSSDLEARHSGEHLIHCVSQSIERMDTDPRTRRQLATLWQFLQIQAGFEEPALRGLARHLPEGGKKDGISHRKLAQLLQIPRERFPLLFQHLQRLADRCQQPQPARSGRFS